MEKENVTGEKDVTNNKYEYVNDIDSNGRYAILIEASNDDKKYAIKMFKDEYKYCPYVLELECLSLSCPHIARGRSLVYVNDKIGVVLDLAEGDGIWLTMNEVSWNNKRKMFREAIIAIDYLHRCGILHLDLKPGNFLIYKEKCESDDRILSLKVADFSLSVRAELKQGSLYKEFDLDRTPDAYRCPEFKNDKYTDKHDIWSLGMSLLYMSIDNEKYMGEFGDYLSEPDIRIKFKQLLNECKDSIFVDLIENMIESDPIKRFDMKDIFKHEFMQGIKHVELVQQVVKNNNSSSFQSWCKKKDINDNIVELANVILDTNDELFEGLFSVEYDKTLKKMTMWSVALSIAGELINNYKDESAHFSVLFAPKHLDAFLEIIHKAKKKFIYRKYRSVFEESKPSLIQINNF